jgi:uncharacterized phage infection (PIP) family protein YhgE
MDTFKRILAGLVIFISAMGVLLCVASIFAVWSVNQQLTNSLTSVLDQAEAVLVFTQDELSNVDSQLEEAQDHLATLNQVATESGDQLIENSPTMQLVKNLVGAKLAPKIQTTAGVVSTIRGTIISVNSTLETIRRLPFVNLPTFSMNRLATIDQRMQDLVNDANNLVVTVQDIEDGAIDRATSVIVAQTNRLSNRIERVQTRIANFNLRLSTVESGISNAKARIPYVIDWVSILLTLVIFWVMLALVGLSYLGWYYWNWGALPTIKNPAVEDS